MAWSPDRDALRGRVAVVAGATRGAGRGIAAGLGEAGATVVCTGRSSRTRSTPSDYDRPETIEETAEHNAARYRISVFSDLAKVAVNRLAFSQGHELEPFGATAVAITPGWLRSEMMLDNFGVSEANWRESASAPPDFALSESPRYA